MKQKTQNNNIFQNNSISQNSSISQNNSKSQNNSISENYVLSTDDEMMTFSNNFISLLTFFIRPDW